MGSIGNIDTTWRLEHRPGNPIAYPDEVATVDKITNGEFFPKDILTNARDYFPDYGNFRGTEKLLNILKQAQNNPENASASLSWSVTSASSLDFFKTSRWASVMFLKTEKCGNRLKF